MTYTTSVIKIIGYSIVEVEDAYGNWESTAYNVYDSLTSEWLFQIFQTTKGWKTGFTRQTYETPQQAVSVSREKLIERIERSLQLEVWQINMAESDGYGDAFMVRNRDTNRHYVIRPQHPEHHERCECPDTIYRGVECKHQQAVHDFLEDTPSWKRQATMTYTRLVEGEKLTIDTAAGEAVLSYETDTRFRVNYLCTTRERGNAAASTKLIMSLEKLEKYVFDLYNPRIIEAFGSANPRFDSQSPTSDIQFISLDGFYDWEVIVNGEIIANIYYNSKELTQPYNVVVDGVVVHQTNTQAKAENYVRWHYKNGSLLTHEESCTPSIEDCDYLDERGSQYIFRIGSQAVGHIWLIQSESDINDSWINGSGKEYECWIECGLELVAKHEAGYCLTDI